MTEFEMATLFTELQVAAVTAFSVVLSVSSGFLVAGYIIAHRLGWLMTTIIVGMYSWYMFASIGIIARLQVSIAGLTQKMTTESAAGKGLEWHANHIVPIPKFLADPDTARAISVAFGIAIWVGAVAFFFLARRMNLKRERDETAARLAAEIALRPPRDQ